MLRTSRVLFYFVILGLIAGGFAGFGAAFSGQSETHGGNGVGLRVSEAPEEEELLSEVNRELPSDVRLRFTDVPADFVEGFMSVGASSGVWLEVSLPPRLRLEEVEDPYLEAVRQARARWEGTLALGTYRDRAVSSGMRIVAGISYRAGDAVTDSGLLAFEAGTPDTTTGQVLPVASDKAAIQVAVQEGASLGNMTVDRLAYANPAIAPAPVVELTATQPKAALEARSRWLGRMTGRGKFVLEGWFIVIRDAAGAPFYVSAVSHRAGGGSAWVRPDLAESFRQGGSLGPLIIPADK